MEKVQITPLPGLFLANCLIPHFTNFFAFIFCRFLYWLLFSNFSIGRLASVRHEDLDMYRNVLANPNFSWGNSSNKSQFVRSPMFQRDETPAIQRSYMKSGSSKLSIFQQLEKYQKKKPTGTSPELVTIDDPIIHR